MMMMKGCVQYCPNYGVKSSDTIAQRLVEYVLQRLFFNMKTSTLIHVRNI